MIRSMTGFGRSESIKETRKISVELKSVNNRYLDLNIRMPRKFNFLEAKIRSVLKEYMSRGKVDVFISTEEYGDERGTLRYNAAIAQEYAVYMREMADTLGLKDELTVKDIASMPDVFTIGDSSLNEDELWAMIEPTVRDAAEKFDEARTLEGERLKEDLIEKLDSMSVWVDEIIAREPEIMADYKARLQEKLKEVLEDKDLDESRIAAEVVIYSDKICTDEETVRLKSHIKQMKGELGKTESIGRKLDFLAQEMNREANTILSKAADLATSDRGIDLKTQIEKIREQIQNIE